MNTAKVLVGDNRKRLAELPDGSVQCVVTSPPYWGLRDYGKDDQIGMESTPDEFVEQLCLVFDEVWRVLADDGTLWLNLGDSYMTTPAGNKTWGDGVNRNKHYQDKNIQGNHKRPQIDGLKNKDLVGIPWRVAFALQARGWYLRQDIIWAKPNPMPESVTDRCTKSHEYIFLLSKSAQYFFDHEAIKEKATTPIPDQTDELMRNKRDVWQVSFKPYKDAHFATYPPELVLPCILAGSKPGDFILDPFSGSGTTGEVALQLGRNYVGCELNPEYALLSEKRISEAVGLFGSVELA